MTQPINPGFTPTKGRKPRTGQDKLTVQFRSFTDWQHAYTADQLVWDDRGYAFDVIAVRKA